MRKKAEWKRLEPVWTCPKCGGHQRFFDWCITCKGEENERVSGSHAAGVRH